MPRAGEYHSRRERGLCTQCPEATAASKCRRCRQKERERASRGHPSALTSYGSIVKAYRAARRALEDAPARESPGSLAEHAAAAIREAGGPAALMERARELRAGPHPPAPGHRHHWIVGPPRDGVEPAVCRTCGAERTFARADASARARFAGAGRGR